MRRSLLRGVATLTMTMSLAVFLTAIQPSPALADSSGSIGTTQTGVNGSSKDLGSISKYLCGDLPCNGACPMPWPLPYSGTCTFTWWLLTPGCACV